MSCFLVLPFTFSDFFTFVSTLNVWSYVMKTSVHPRPEKFTWWGHGIKHRIIHCSQFPPSYFSLLLLGVSLHGKVNASHSLELLRELFTCICCVVFEVSVSTCARLDLAWQSQAKLLLCCFPYTENSVLWGRQDVANQWDVESVGCRARSICCRVSCLCPCLPYLYFILCALTETHGNIRKTDLGYFPSLIGSRYNSSDWVLYCDRRHTRAYHWSTE